MNIVELLASSSYIVVNKNLARAIGLNEALVLGELAAEYKYWVETNKASGDWFYSTNENLVERLPFSERTVRRTVERLVELGLVETRLAGMPAKKHYRLVIDKIVEHGWPKVLEQDWPKVSEQVRPNWPTKNNKEEYINKNIGDDVENLSNKDGQNEGGVQKSEYGNHEVNALLELWEHETGITANVAKANRIAAYNLLRRRGFDGAKAVIELCGRAIKSGDPYAPRVSSFRDLQGKYEKLSKLEAWEARNNPPVEEGITMDYYTHDTIEYTEPTDEQWERTRELMREARKNLPFLQKKGGKK